MLPINKEQYLSRFTVKENLNEKDARSKELCKQWQPFFKENIYWLPHRYTLERAKTAFQACHKQQKYTIAYFRGIINNLSSTQP